MGKKADRIEELEAELADAKAELVAAKFLLRYIGDHVGVDLCEHPHFNMSVAPELLRQFKEADALRGSGPSRRTGRRAPRNVAPGSWDTHDEEVDEQIDRMEAQGLTKPRGGAMVQVGRDGGEAVEPTILKIADELGISVDHTNTSEALDAIATEIVRVKSMGADVEAESANKFLAKGDSLGQAVASGHAQNAELRDGVTQARTIVARLAAVMQIDKWDQDGTELLERAQRWEGWKHELKRRIRALRGGLILGEPLIKEATAIAIADELQTHLERLMSRKEMVDFVKALPGTPAAQVVVHAPYPLTFRATDPATIRRAITEAVDGGILRGEVRTRDVELQGVFNDIGDSVVASEEFARAMNVVILPILARQKAAQRVPDPDPPSAA